MLQLATKNFKVEKKRNVGLFFTWPPFSTTFPLKFQTVLPKPVRSIYVQNHTKLLVTSYANFLTYNSQTKQFLV